MVNGHREVQSMQRIHHKLDLPWCSDIISTRHEFLKKSMQNATYRRPTFNREAPPIRLRLTALYKFALYFFFVGTGNYIFCVNNTALGNLSAYKAFV